MAGFACIYITVNFNTTYEVMLMMCNIDYIMLYQNKFRVRLATCNRYPSLLRVRTGAAHLGANVARLHS